MKYIDFIQYLISPQLLGDLYEGLGVGVESEALLIYLKDELDIESEIYIFSIEETEDDLFFEKDGYTYRQLFPVDYAVELIEKGLQLKDSGYSNVEMAQRLLDYRLRDA